ncbi:MAG: glycosyltransferase [Bacteroidales bacterium]|nr:glycosyltransferase [Bacteroidales bacterium]
MDSAPLISIITITYNAATVLPTTMKSVATQSFRDFEHLIIDGASTDDTLLVGRSNPDTRIISEPDKGLYDAMNKGLKAARGKYVIFLNAGDAFRDNDVLEDYAQAAAKDADIIYADTMIVNAGGVDISPRHYSVPDTLTHDSFSRGMLICHQAFMVKRNLAPEYNLAYRFSADYDWTIRCINKSIPEKCINLKRVAINYLSDGLTDRNKWASLRERYHVMADHYGHSAALRRHATLILAKLIPSLDRR